MSHHGCRAGSRPLRLVGFIFVVWTVAGIHVILHGALLLQSTTFVNLCQQRQKMSVRPCMLNRHSSHVAGQISYINTRLINYFFHRHFEPAQASLASQKMQGVYGATKLTCRAICANYAAQREYVFSLPSLFHIILRSGLLSFAAQTTSWD